MPSPVLHCATGAALYCLGHRPLGKHRGRCVALVMLAAILPDFDFLPGLLLGDPNRFHSGLTHSIGFAIIAAGVLGVLAGERRRLVAVLAFAAYLSHVLMDTLTVDKRPPFGVPVFWPFSERTLHAQRPLLPGISHGVDSSPVGEFMDSVFCTANLQTIGIEAAIGALLVLLCAGIGTAIRSRGRRSTRIGRTSIEATGAVAGDDERG